MSTDKPATVFWDRELPGSHASASSTSEAKVYVVQTRAFGRSKRVTVEPQRHTHR